jgi:hypothetical protein
MTPEERVADLVRHGCPPEANHTYGLPDACSGCVADAIRAAVAEEREACARVAEATNDCCECTTDDCCKGAYCVTAVAIRARR